MIYYLLGIVLFAVDAVIADETAGLPVEGKLANAAAQTMRMPAPPGHLQQELIGDRLLASSAGPVLRLKVKISKK